MEFSFFSFRIAIREKHFDLFSVPVNLRHNVIKVMCHKLTYAAITLRHLTVITYKIY
jgi:hypothetical protein